MSRRIGRYEIQGLIGQGGFGQVFRAFDPIVGRPVAIKTITAGNDADLIQRFRNEAAAAGRLRHSNIIIIFDFGEDNGVPFLVMELLDGEDLERTIRGNRRLSLLEKLDVITQAAAGLHHAHAAGIVHRDVKPANIMLQSDGVVKIMDFGIALLTQATAARMTATGEIPGTVSYMAPEQLIAGQGSDALTDIWGFGVTCYKLLTGVHPFPADTLGATVYKIVNSRPEPIRGLMPDCPEALEQAVMRMIASDRDLRYRSLEDLRFDLEPIVADLRRERINELLATAREMIAGNRLDSVPRLLSSVLDADPANRTAREIREELQRKVRENEIRPRVAALVQEGRDHMQARRFDVAVERFESALRLDHSNPEIHRGLAEVQLAQQRSERLERMLQGAQDVLSGGDLTGAQKLIVEALSTDPEHPEAARLLDEVNVRIGQRDRERRLEEELNQARRLVLLESFAEAVASLERVVGRYPESAAATELLARARKEQEEQDRRLQLQRVTVKAKDAIKGGQFSEALEALKQARAEFPEASELLKLERLATEELAAERQAEVVGNATAEAHALAQERRFDDALSILRSALAEYPGVSALREEIESIDRARNENKRHRALEDAKAEVETLLESENLKGAAERIEIFARDYGASPELESLRKEVERALDAQRRQAAARDLAANAGTLLEQGKAESATRLLRKATVQFPGEAHLERLLGEAEQSLKQQRADEAISRIISEAESLSRSRQFPRALEVLEAALREYPMAERLERCRQATLAIQQRHQKDERALEAIEKARGLREKGALNEALSEIDAVLVDVGDYPALRKLRGEIEQARDREQALSELRSRVVRLREEGRITAALEAIAADWERASEDPEIAALRSDLEFRQLVSRAEELLGADRPTEAVALLEKAKEFQDRPSVAELLARAHERIAALEQERAVAAAEVVIRNLASEGRFTEALRGADLALQRFPGNDRLAEVGRFVAAALEQAEAIASASEEAERLLGIGRPSEALALLAPLAAQYPADVRVEALRREAERQTGAVEAESLLAQDRPEEAILLIEQRFPGEESFDELLARARERASALRQRAAVEAARLRLVEIEHALPSTTPRKKLKKLAEEAKRVAAVHADEEDLRIIAARIEERVAEALAVDPPKIGLAKRLILAGCAAVVAAGVLRLWHPSAPAKVTLFALEVRTDPEGSAVSVDGRKCGTAVCRFDLPAGPYTVHAERPGYRSVDRTVTLGAGRPAGLMTLSLESQAPPPQPETQTGVLTVRAIPGARVWVDDSPKGLTNSQGEFSATVPAGQHEVRVDKAGFSSAPGQPVTVAAERPERLEVELVPLMGKLEIRGAPAGVKVQIGNRKGAVTDGARQFRLAAPPGDYALHISDANGRKETAIRIQPGASSVFDWPAIAPAPKPAAPLAGNSPIQKATQPGQSVPVPVDTPEQREAQLFDKARKSGDPAEVGAFLRDHPNSRFVSEARSALDELTWGRTNRNNVDSVRDYVTRFPRGAHLADAQAQLLRLAPPPSAPISPVPRPAVPEAEMSGLQAAIQRFNNAFLRKSAKELKQAWPSVPDTWRSILQQKGAMSIATLYPQGQPEIRGDHATWRCELLVQIILRGQPQPPERKTVTVALRRGGAGWVIESL